MREGRRHPLLGARWKRLRGGWGPRLVAGFAAAGLAAGVRPSATDLEARAEASPAPAPASTAPAVPAATGASATGAGAPGHTSCLACHGNPDLFDADKIHRIVQGFAGDVHAQVGLSCHDCHGGDPDLRLAGDMDAAMNRKFAANPYRGAPERGAVPDFCGRCHADPVYMKRFRPDARVDQENEYWTSHHGQALRRGNTRVATCIDCHGVHGIRRPDDPDSPVYPTHVAETCNRCHGSAERMAGSTLPDGRPLPIDQFARWQQSVHARALLQKGDLSAPTCNDCHGNHGAAPPGLDSVAFVCGQCHGREAALFRASRKHAGFAQHNTFLADAGKEGCASCHVDPEPAASLHGMTSFSECTTCHGNHSIVRPTLALLAPLPSTPCAFCHEPPGENLIPEPKRSRESYAGRLSALLDQAKSQGLEGEELFDWLVDRARELPTHTLAASEPGTPPELRPEFARLFEKFRIGKIHYMFIDPVSGKSVSDRVTRCTDCHAAQPQAAPSPVGLTVAEDHLHRMQELTGATARAERMLLSARRGGVEVREALLALDRAVDAQIELEVLVHDFSDTTAAFAAKQVEGLENARAALAGAQKGMQELQDRRRGLALSLGFVVLVLIGLGLRIRQVSA
jgi:hypothetical protein